MIRAIKYILLTFIITLCEHSMGKYLAIGSAMPMLTFCFVILAAMHEKNREYSMIFGILSGALCDILGGHGFGTYTVVFGVTAWETALLCDSILTSRFLFMIINTFIMTIFAQGAYILLHIIEIGGGMFAKSFVEIILPTALYNIVITAIFYKPMKRIFYEGR